MIATARGCIYDTKFAIISGRFNNSAFSSSSGPIVWNGIPPTDLYYSNQWQVLEEDVEDPTPGVEQAAIQYVWGQAYVDEMVLRDRRSGNNPGTNYGTSTSGLDERLYVAQDADWNTTGLITMSGTMPEGFADAPYGNNLLTTTGTTDIYNWVYFHQGGRLDTTSGLYLFRHRDYAPGSWGNNPYVMGRWMEEDPAGYVEGLNLYQAVSDSPVEKIDPSGTDSGGEVLPVSTIVYPIGPPFPVYNPHLPRWWNDPWAPNPYNPNDVQYWNNCYNYACDRPFRPRFWQPGAFHDDFPWDDPTTCAGLRFRVKQDGAKDPDCRGNCPMGYHKIRLWADPGKDFHFYRQDPNGTWSNKPGHTPAAPIQDPSLYHNYQPCGDLCVQN
jgi:RHS repeat-associated protein